MPASIDDYFRNLLEHVSEAGVVRSSDLNFDKRSTMLGLVRGQIYFIDGSLLHIRELIDLRRTPARVMYVYHFQDPDGGLIFRYDNTAHHPELPDFPHHKHNPTVVAPVSGDPPDLVAVLAEVETFIR
jgi:hypothetical protein